VGFFEMTAVRKRHGLGLLLAALWFAGQVAGSLHMLFVPHVFCAEHGELIESEVGQANSVRADQSPDSDEATSSLASDVDKLSGVHAHQHCFVASRAQRQAISQHGSQREIEAVRHNSAIQAAGEDPLTLQVPLFRLAPKNSPPA
jgi:hypothetical protein